MKWIKASDQLPEFNISVLVFIPEEDNHVTTGMWDISKKWVLLDDYRVPDSEVTYWAEMVDRPTDLEYTPSTPKEDDTIQAYVRELQKENYDLKMVLRDCLTICRKHASDDPYEDHITDHAESLLK